MGATSGVYETQENVKNNLKETGVTGGSQTNHAIDGGFNHYLSTGEFEYWSATSNVARNYGGVDRAIFDLQEGVTDSISQELMLLEGYYTAAFDIRANNDVYAMITFTATSVAGSGFSYIKEFVIDNSSLLSKTERVSASFEVGNYVKNGDRIEIKISVTGYRVGSSYSSVDIDGVTVSEGVTTPDYNMVTGGSVEYLTRKTNLKFATELNTPVSLTLFDW